MENTDSEIRVYAPLGSQKRQVSAERLLCNSVHFLKICHGLGRCVELIYIEPGVKINGAYYRDVLLGRHLLPAIRSVAGDFFTFRQDNAPAHRAGGTVEFLSRNTPDFISPLLWPPKSPNPVDHEVWGVLQQRVYSVSYTHLTLPTILRV